MHSTTPWQAPQTQTTLAFSHGLLLIFKWAHFSFPKIQTQPQAQFFFSGPLVVENTVKNEGEPF